MAKTAAEWMCELMCGADEDALDENIKTYAQYMIDYKCSIRKLAEEFDVSKSAMHRYLTQRLKYIDDDLFVQCRNIMKANKKG